VQKRIISAVKRVEFVSESDSDSDSDNIKRLLVSYHCSQCLFSNRR
jgi:hypothetical protein